MLTMANVAAVAGKPLEEAAFPSCWTSNKMKSTAAQTFVHVLSNLPLAHFLQHIFVLRCMQMCVFVLPKTLSCLK